MKSLILSLLTVVVLASCTDYGKKIMVDGTKAEIFYKGDGVTEADAKKVGDYLKKSGFLTSDKPASIQVSKTGERYTVRFVYDKEFYDKQPQLEDVFKLYGAKMSKELFDSKKVDIALADKSFKDFKNIPYDEATAKKLDAPKEDLITKKEDYDHDKAGGVNFYWKGISDEEAKTIADYIVKNGSFSGGNAEIYITKEGDRYILSFPVLESSRTDAAYLAEIDKVSKQIKDNLFADAPFSFVITDEYLKTVKTWDY